MSGKRALIVFFIFMLFFSAGAAAFYTFLPMWVKQDTIQKALLGQIEALSENPCTFSQTRITYFPQVKMEITDFAADRKGQIQMRLEAKAFKIYLRMLPLLVRNVRVGGIEVEGGRLTGLTWPVEDMHLRVRAAPWGKPVMMFDLKGTLAQASESLEAKGDIFYQAGEKPDWLSLKIDGKIFLRNFRLQELKGPLPFFPVQIESGEWGAEVQFAKKKNEASLEILGQSLIRGFVYQVQREEKIAVSSSMDLESDFDMAWNPLTGELRIHSSRLSSPLGILEAEGQGAVATGQIGEFRIRGTNIALDQIPQFWIPLKKALPANLGFSGLSDFELSLGGTWDDLSVHASWDLTPTILTYTRYFSKPKDLPLNGIFDFSLKENKILSGDFSLKFPDTTLKGTFTDFNLETAEGQINLITNKFPLKSWESMLIPFKDYKVDGSAKILGNWSGNFHRPQELKPTLNVTIEKGQFLKAQGAGLSDVNLILDYGTLGILVKQTRFSIGASVFKTDFSIYHPFENPAGQGTVSAIHLEPSRVLTYFSDWASEWLSPQASGLIDNLKVFFQNPFFDKEPIEQLDAEISYEDSRWQIQRLALDSYGGKIVMQGKLDFKNENPAYKIDAEVERLNMTRLTADPERGESLIEGNLFLKSHFEGIKPVDQNWLDALQGEGSFIVTNGQFRSFNLLEKVSQIPELKSLSGRASGVTSFDDVHSRFRLKDRKISLEKMILVSPDISIEGNGETGFDGVLNYRLNLYLSAPLTTEIMEPLFGPGLSSTGKQLGPIALLLSGPLAKPQLQPDPELLPRFMEQLLLKKPQKILTNFLPEELFFDRRTSNS